MSDKKRVVGIIAEYNPFHKGHLYHLNCIKATNPDLIIATISSSFTSRGDLTIMDLKSRVEIALLSGIDIVISNPYLSVMESSDFFALNSLTLLGKMGVNELVIGSEKNDSTLYPKYEDLKKSDEFNQKFKEFLSLGYSYQLAFSKSLSFFGYENLKPNDLLGLNYYEAIKKLNLDIELKTIKRLGSDFNDDEINSSYPSAKALRKNPQMILELAPESQKSFFENYSYRNNNLLYHNLVYQLKVSDINELRDIFLIKEGIESKIKSVESTDYDSLVKSLLSKRVSEAYIKRVLANILFQVKNSYVKTIDFKADLIPLVLGFNEKGRLYLNAHKKEFVYKTKWDLENKIDLVEKKVFSVLKEVYPMGFPIIKK